MMATPLENRPVTPEAEQLVARNRAERNLERSMPKRWWHDAAFGWGGIGVFALIVGSVAVVAWLLLFK